ncbi:MAG: hypothetical protein CMJ48_14080 [Planctomycetaceae bacterium]|nr:hypothetical protein [Planctomycetaceae bacterium]
MLIGAAVFFASRGAVVEAGEPAPLPEFAAVQSLIVGHFESIKGYRENDLLSQGDVKPLFKKIEEIGWPVEDGDAILKQVLPDNAFIVRELRTRQGKKFMRRISKHPEAYDRLQRYGAMSRGRRNVRDLVHRPGGHTLIQYMTTTRGGRKMGRELAATPTGKGFDQKTEQIYTAKQLLDRLQKSYDDEVRRRTDATVKSAKRAAKDR